MGYKVVISALAEKTYFQNIQYLENYWTPKEVKQFILKVSEVNDLLKNNPFAFEVWEADKTVRRVPIVKQITLFYGVSENTVALLLFWNNFQDPEKLLDLL